MKRIALFSGLSAGLTTLACAAIWLLNTRDTKTALMLSDSLLGITVGTLFFCISFPERENFPRLRAFWQNLRGGFRREDRKIRILPIAVGSLSLFFFCLIAIGYEKTLQLLPVVLFAGGAIGLWLTSLIWFDYGIWRKGLLGYTLAVGYLAIWLFFAGAFTVLSGTLFFFVAGASRAGNSLLFSELSEESLALITSVALASTTAMLIFTAYIWKLNVFAN